MDLKKVGKFFGVLFFIFFLFYSIVYIQAANKSQNVQVNYSFVSDIGDVDPNLDSLVKKYISLYELDSSNRFNPKSNLTRMDAILLIDNIAKQTNPKYITTKPTTVPYFDDFKSTDEHSDAVLRVVNLVDTKENFYKHYNILGYDFNRDNPITLKEYLNLLAVFVPVDTSLGDNYIIKNLSKYGIDLSGDMNSTISRQKSVVYLDKIMKSIN